MRLGNPYRQSLPGAVYIRPVVDEFDETHLGALHRETVRSIRTALPDGAPDFERIGGLGKEDAGENGEHSPLLHGVH
jgi:hypothetical protein